MINPKRRSIYIEQDHTSHRARSSSSVNSRSQSMPKLNPSRRSQSPSMEHYFQQQNPSSRSSSPKSFSDHGFASESNSHLSSGEYLHRIHLNENSSSKVLRMVSMDHLLVNENVCTQQHLEENVCVLNLIEQI